MVCVGKCHTGLEELDEMSNEACPCEAWCCATVSHCTAVLVGPIDSGKAQHPFHTEQHGGKAQIACANVHHAAASQKVPSSRKQGEDSLIQPMLSVAMGSLLINKQVNR